MTAEKQKSSTFTLHVDPVKIDRDFKTMERGQNYHVFNPMVTKLEDLGISEEKISDTIFTTIGNCRFVSHYPDYMSDKSYPQKTEIPCFYCTEPFSNPPIGIPLRFIPSMVKIVTTDATTRESTTNYRQLKTTRDLEEAKRKKEHIIYRDYFQTEGNFCSFPCLQSYIRYHYQEDAQGSELYPLLKQYYRTINGSDTSYEREFAPDIRLLKKYGGHLSITEFRSAEGRKYKRSINLFLPKFEETDVPAKHVPCSRMFQYFG
jgi:hypothetical protein